MVRVFPNVGSVAVGWVPSIQMSVTDRFKAALQQRGAASFLLAAVVLGVLVGLAAALLVILVELVSEFSLSYSEWTGWGIWAVVVTIPVGMTISWLINKRWGPEIGRASCRERV